MATYLLRRALLMVPTLVGITFAVFMLVALSPGGVGAGLAAAMESGGDTGATAAQRAYLEDRYGLNDPVLVQYGRWLNQVSPIRLGESERIGPSGERLRLPRLPPPPSDHASANPNPPSPAARTDESTAAPALTAAIARFEAARQRYLAIRARPPGTPDDEASLAKAWEEVTRLHAFVSTLFRAPGVPTAGIQLIPGLLAVDRPDLGQSFVKGRPVWTVIAEALPNTLLINLTAFAIVYFVAIPGGVLAAIRRGTWLDRALTGLFTGLWSVPTVCAGMLALGYLASSRSLGWFPASGLHDAHAHTFTWLPSRDAAGALHRGFVVDTLWHLCLPVLCQAYVGLAVLARQTRAAMIESLGADHIRTARAKGVPERDVVIHHAFRNSLLPIITMFGAIFPAMLSGSIVIERIFSINGMGSLVIESVYLRDRELLLGVVLIAGLVNVAATLVADVLYAAADPRVSYA